MRYIPILMLLFQFSCRGAEQDRPLLHEAGLLSDSIPSQTFAKLQAIKHSQKFSETDQAKYDLLSTKAWINTGIKPPDDSPINAESIFTGNKMTPPLFLKHCTQKKAISIPWRNTIRHSTISPKLKILSLLLEIGLLEMTVPDKLPAFNNFLLNIFRIAIKISKIKVIFPQ